MMVLFYKIFTKPFSFKKRNCILPDSKFNFFACRASLCSFRDESSRLRSEGLFPEQRLLIERKVQSNLFNTNTKETEPSVRFTEVSVL